MKLIHWLCLTGLLLSSGISHAVTCTITGVSVVNFGTIAKPLTATPPTTSMTFSYACAKEIFDTLGNVNICFNIGTATPLVSARVMTRTGTPASSLGYQLYQDLARTNVWGNQYQAGTTFPKLRLSLLNLTTVTGQLTVYGALNSASMINAVPGTYQDSTVTATVTRNTVGTLDTSTACGTGVAATFTVPVNAIISKQCNINYANNVTVGPVNANQSNIAGMSSLGVACTNNTPYTIGLLPSNNNTSGNGTMKGTRSGNTDIISYQLRSTTGSTGTIWGNTTQNTVAGTGTSTTINHNVYVTVPSANYTPDSYSDTVTINVTY